MGKTLRGSGKPWLKNSGGGNLGQEIKVVDEGNHMASARHPNIGDDSMDIHRELGTNIYYHRNLQWNKAGPLLLP